MSKDKKKQKEPEYNVELIKRIQPHDDQCLHPDDGDARRQHGLYSGGQV